MQFELHRTHLSIWKKQTDTTGAFCDFEDKMIGGYLLHMRQMLWKIKVTLRLKFGLLCSRPTWIVYTQWKQQLLWEHVIQSDLCVRHAAKLKNSSKHLHVCTISQRRPDFDFRFWFQGAAAPVRARHSVGFVCEPCGKKFASSAAFDRHRTCGYLRGTACFVGDEGSTKYQLVATKRNNVSTASLEKRKMLGRKRGT